MKCFVLSVLGFYLVSALNYDQLLDEANYASSTRSKRALCVKPTSKPFTWPTRDPSCISCNCYPWRNPIISKRATLDTSKLGIINPWPRPSCYARCCNTILKSGGLPSSAVKTASVKDMAANLVNIIGKRSNDKFKKPSMDLVFLIDDSGSIPAPQFKIAKEGAATLAESLCPRKFGTVKGTKQVATVLFSTTPKTIMTFRDSREGSGEVEKSIINMQQRSGATATADALKHIRTKVLGKDGSRLNDPDTATVVLVITDGKCNNGCQALKEEARKLRETGPGVQVFAFGVGEADCDELEVIRGREAGEVFGLADYNLFEKLADAVKEEIAGNANACM